MRVLPPFWLRYIAASPRSARSFPHVEFTWIISSATSMSTGVPRLRGSIATRPPATRMM
jgi:hypothetical protein